MAEETATHNIKAGSFVGRHDRRANVTKVALTAGRRGGQTPAGRGRGEFGEKLVATAGKGHTPTAIVIKPRTTQYVVIERRDIIAQRQFSVENVERRRFLETFALEIPPEPAGLWCGSQFCCFLYCITGSISFLCGIALLLFDLCLKIKLRMLLCKASRWEMKCFVRQSCVVGVCCSYGPEVHIAFIFSFILAAKVDENATLSPLEC